MFIGEDLFTNNYISSILNSIIIQYARKFLPKLLEESKLNVNGLASDDKTTKNSNTQTKNKMG